METRIPTEVVDMLLDIAPDHPNRSYRRLMLAPDACSATEQFRDALVSQGVRVESDVCDTDPNEICVKAHGRDHAGRTWDGTVILMLDPEWDRHAEMAQMLADDFVELWPRIPAAGVAAAR